MPKPAVLIWGTQLHPANSALAAAPDAPVVMIESAAVCRRFRYHKHKLILVLSAMRGFADELRAAGRTVHYVGLEDAEHDGFFEQLAVTLRQLGCDQLYAMEQNDRGPQARLQAWTKQAGIELTATANTLFLTSHEQFQSWAGNKPHPLMENFYRTQRRRLGLLMDETGQPAGGQWNYDHDNRQALPKGHVVRPLPPVKPTEHVRAVQRLVGSRFATHPGETDTFWLPTTRRQAEAWLADFIEHRLENFGRYEDAMRAGEPFLYHSILSPLLNIGLLHPRDITDRLEEAYRSGAAPLAGVEGCLRQIIGWREFMFGMYHHRPADWKQANQLQQDKQLEAWWYTGDVDEIPLQDVINRVIQYGYAHHIERLMVLGNYLLIGGYSPQAAYGWFMDMFVDSYEWVMVPNVIGMSQYADGGSFATKPYISGANYLQKMGGWWSGPTAAKQSAYTPLYWEFLRRHRQRFAGNQRMALVLKQLDRRP